jgi:predicted transposase/invertase (TIGR01784 family)
MKKINPRVDIAFKKIFGVEENKDLLISLINSIVGEEDQVVEVTLLNPYNLQSFKTDKLSILDIKAKSETGKRFNIEIQITDESDYDKRALYYWGKLYTEQLKVSEEYSTLSKAIGIHILNFTSIPDVDNYHNIFHIVEKKTGVQYFKDLELHTIELTKFSNNSNEELDELLAKIKRTLDIWVTFLTRNDLINRENLPDKLDNPLLKKALHVLDVMSFGELELQAYEERLKWLRVEANTLKKYEAKAREEGREEGQQIGIIKTARIMRSKGLPIAVINECTGLSESEIEKL